MSPNTALGPSTERGTKLMYLFSFKVYIQKLNKGVKGRTKGNIAHMCVHNSIRMRLELWAILKIDIIPNHRVGSETPLHQ